MNIGDWLSPIIVGIIAYFSARQEGKSKLKKATKEHQIKVQELEHQHEQDLYNKLSSVNDTLWQRIDEVDKKSRDRENELNAKIDGLYRQVGHMRDYANRLRGQIIEASLIPAPWPEES